MELAVLGGPIALRREHDGLVGVGHGALEQEDVGFLAGLENPKLGVDRGTVGDEPVGHGPGPAAERFDVPVGREALAVHDVVEGAVGEDERRVDVVGGDRGGASRGVEDSKRWSGGRLALPGGLSPVGVVPGGAACGHDKNSGERRDRRAGRGQSWT